MNSKLTNLYVFMRRSGNWEVMFRASNDGGQTFGDKINLSNSPDTQSQTAESRQQNSFLKSAITAL
jgi:hypothetical protein